MNSATETTVSTSVQVRRDLFIGSGKHAWLIAGRKPFADDDSVQLILANDEEEAQQVFTDMLYPDPIDEELQAHLIDEHGGPVIFTESMMLSHFEAPTETVV